MKKRLLLYIMSFLLLIIGITNVKAADKYEGEYTIEYLLRNYNVVTLGKKPVHDWSINGVTNGFAGTSSRTYRGDSGSVSYVFDIGGPVLINGDYIVSSNLQYDNEFAQKTKGVPSYIKGNIGQSISPGSIESHEISNIYVGKVNKIIGNKINGNENTYEYPVTVSDDYLDFNKLYAAVVNESNSIEKGSPITILRERRCDRYSGCSDGNATIEKPGIYYIQDIGSIQSISITNYNPSELYIINYYGQYVYKLPRINISTGERFLPSENSYQYPDGLSVYCGRNSDNDSCSGNIIWNMPNARYIDITTPTNEAHLVAPKADVNIVSGNFANTFIVNSISSQQGTYTAIQYRPYNIDVPLSATKVTTNLEESEDDITDFYEGSYSIEEFLRNYSVIALGQHNYSEKTILNNLTDTYGTVSIFHISGQYLINGNLGIKGYKYLENLGIRLEHHFSEVGNPSFLKGKIMADTFSERWVLNSFVNSYFYSLSYIEYVSSLNTPYKYFQDVYLTLPNVYTSYKVGNDIYKYMATSTLDNYINFTTLYNKIVEQQKQIDRGKEKTKDSNGNIHLQIGGNYTIRNASELNHIIFTNFEDNKDMLTIITIEDEGEVSLPIVGYGTNNSTKPTLVPTNDFIYGSTYKGNEPITYDEIYYGNIVWNIPNATYITLAKDAPFVGHIIAPNADVETPELHFAGTMIVNSLYAEGLSEAHYYPLTSDENITKNSTEAIYIKVNKVWIDNNNKDRSRPKSIKVQLYGNGKEIGNSVELSDNNNWSWVFNEPSKDENNKEIVYTIKEVGNIDGYKTTISGNQEKGFTITNSKIAKDNPLDENPQTGIFFPLITITCGLLSGIIIYKIFNRNKKVYKI